MTSETQAIKHTHTHTHTEHQKATPTTKLEIKGLSQQAEVVQKVPGRLRARIFLTLGTTRVVGRQPYIPAAFTPGEIILNLRFSRIRTKIHTHEYTSETKCSNRSNERELRFLWVITSE
jgi:hypothetical protein